MSNNQSSSRPQSYNKRADGSSSNNQGHQPYYPKNKGGNTSGQSQRKSSSGPNKGNFHTRSGNYPRKSNSGKYNRERDGYYKSDFEQKSSKYKTNILDESIETIKKANQELLEEIYMEIQLIGIDIKKPEN